MNRAKSFKETENWCDECGHKIAFVCDDCYPVDEADFEKWEEWNRERIARKNEY